MKKTKKTKLQPQTRRPVQVSFTPEERAEVSSAALQSGLSTAAFIRMKAIEGARAVVRHGALT